MDCSKTINYICEKNRMSKYDYTTKRCGIDCSKCPIGHTNNGYSVSCKIFEKQYPHEAVAVVQKWSDEHPIKTRLDDFIKKHPDAPLNRDGTPTVCAYKVGYCIRESCSDDIPCNVCWSQPV